MTNLADTPDQAEATVTVRSSKGEVVRLEPTLSGDTCQPEGSLYWHGPANPDLGNATLGDGPFAYEVELVLDGVRYLGTATWPDDQLPDQEPLVALQFTPQLPALS